jgi:creatinine amidohydrolase/Fe(II)-dependent formamide hydrolase-like protein
MVTSTHEDMHGGEMETSILRHAAPSWSATRTSPLITRLITALTCWPWG